MESPRPRGNPYGEADFYLQQAEEEISRSYHELADVGKSTRPVYKKNPRRKRFNRRYRRSNTVEVCLMNGARRSDSSDSESDRRRVPSLGRLPEAQTSAQTKPKTPKAPPRTKKLRVNVIESDRVQERRKSTKFEDARQKSQSTRELANAGNNDWPSLDFTSADSVTRWASQILEQLDSLPGSRWDLQNGAAPDEGSEPAPAMHHSEAPNDPEKLLQARISLEQACDELLDVSLATNDARQLASSQIDLLVQRIEQNTTNPTRPIVTNGTNKEPMNLPDKKTQSDSEDETPTQSPTRKSKHPPRPSPRKRRSAEVGTEALCVQLDETHRIKMNRRSSPAQQAPQRRSVHGVVASIIRQAEASANVRSASTSTDEELPSPFDDSYDLRDACTQTTPLSLSRSSSFTWMSDPEADLELIRTRPKVPGLSRSSSESERTPSPVRAPTPPAHGRRSNSLHLSDVSGCDSSDNESAAQCPLPPPRRFAPPRQAPPDIPTGSPQPARLEELDESIQLLLQYTDSGNDEELAARAADARRKQKFDTAALQLDKAVLNGKVSEKQQQQSSSSGFMLESVYDNVPAIRRQWMASHGMLRPTVDAWNSSHISTESEAMQYSLTADTPDSLADTPLRLPRDLSVNSGILADSESSPVSPEASDFRMITRTALQEAQAMVGALEPVTPDSLKSLTTSSDEGSLLLGSSETRLETTQPSDISSPDVMMPPKVDFLRGPPPPSPQQRRRPKALGHEVTTTSMPALGRAGSYDALDNSMDRLGSTSNLNSQGSDSGFSSSKEKAEIEAVQCCKWLRAAGFPQYAQMYEEHQFPLDVHSVQNDHEFLDQDSLHALFRRLHALNRCALMKIDNVVLRRDLAEDGSDEEQDNSIALSRKWRYQRKSKTWSRIAEEFEQLATDPPTTDSAMSPQLTTVAEASEKQGSPRPTDTSSLDGGSLKKPSEMVHVLVAERSKAEERQVERPSRGSSKLQRSQSERIKDRAKAFMRRMDIRSSSRRRRPEPRHFDKSNVVIGNPVLVSHHSASPPQMRMLKERAAMDPISQQRLDEQVAANEQGVPAYMKRRGRVFTSPSPTADTQFFNGKQGYLDDNFNRVFVPRGYSGTGQNYSKSNYLVAPAPSPVLSEQQADDQNNCAPLLLYNRSFTRKDADSSPEGTRGHTLQVQVDVEPRAPPRISRTRAAGAQHSHSSLDSSDTDSNRYFDAAERRDSGVGSSLSRSPSGPTKANQRPGRMHRQSSTQPPEPEHMDSLSVGQLITLRKFALLKLTALMERYAPHTRNAGGSQAWNWGVQKLIKKIKQPDNKAAQKERQVFGVSLCSVAQRTGVPMPQCILHAMRFLRQQAPDSIGLFRKSGVRSRIQKLKQICENALELPDFNSAQVYDVADMLKQYFRELPEPLMTAKMSETFIGIFLYVPPELRLEALQKAILLLPDENREVIQTLLFFLRDISLYADTNQMSAQNLSVCFAPSLFQLSSRLVANSPTRRHKTITAGLPNEKELRENQASQTCLTRMIQDCKRLFNVPSTLRERYAMLDSQDISLPCPLAELGAPHDNYYTYLDQCVASMLKEHRDRWKGWVTEGNFDGVEITCKKAADNHPLKFWRCWTDVEAPPKELLSRLIRERDLWDEQTIKSALIARLHDNCELFQYVLNDMPPHPTRDLCVVRLWKTDVLELRGGCALVEVSVTVPQSVLLGGVRANCLASRFLIEPSGAGHSRVTYVSRFDMRGRGKAWHSKVFGYTCARQMAKLRDSFRQIAEGPETKV